MNKKQLIQKWKEIYCAECDGNYNCRDIDGEIFEEQILICMDACPDLVKELENKDE